jgi:predicted house-cleaning noncanonical NTP pyrophosphatase (MazG superfamily)
MEINLSGCPNLQIFKAGGSAITGVSFARNARLHTCVIPNSVSILSLLDLQYLTKEGLRVEQDSDGKYTFTGIRLENCPNVPFYDLIVNSKILKNLRLRGLDWHTTLGTVDSTEPCFMAFYDKIKKLGRINEDGTQDSYSEENKVYAHIAGKIYLEEEIDPKLLEEVNEYLNDNDTSEIADILEVIRAILDHYNVTYEEIEEKRIKKAKKRGAFKEKIFLEKVIQNGD